MVFHFRVLSFVKGLRKNLKRFRLQLFVTMFMSDAMFINHFGHKGPRLEARPWLMAAFYKFIGRCFLFPLSRPAPCKGARLFEIFRCRALKARQVERTKVSS